MASRAEIIFDLSQRLRSLTETHGCGVVVVNQVGDLVPGTHTPLPFLCPCAVKCDLGFCDFRSPHSFGLSETFLAKTTFRPRWIFPLTRSRYG